MTAELRGIITPMPPRSETLFASLEELKAAVRERCVELYEARWGRLTSVDDEWLDHRGDARIYETETALEMEAGALLTAVRAFASKHPDGGRINAHVVRELAAGLDAMIERTTFVTSAPLDPPTMRWVWWRSRIRGFYPGSQSSSDLSERELAVLSILGGFFPDITDRSLASKPLSVANALTLETTKWRDARRKLPAYIADGDRLANTTPEDLARVRRRLFGDRSPASLEPKT